MSVNENETMPIERTKHLEGLPYRLLIYDMVARIRVIAVLNTLHVLKRSLNINKR